MFVNVNDLWFYFVCIVLIVECSTFIMIFEMSLRWVVGRERWRLGRDGYACGWWGGDGFTLISSGMGIKRDRFQSHRRGGDGVKIFGGNEDGRLTSISPYPIADLT